MGKAAVGLILMNGFNSQDMLSKSTNTCDASLAEEFRTRLRVGYCFIYINEAPDRVSYMY